MSAPTKLSILPLHTHTAYSLMDGVSKIEEYVKYCQEQGIEACSCTDHGYVLGLYDLITKTAKTEVKGIPGCLMEGQEIVTSNGVKLVQEIKEGDLVLTHRGRFRRVTRTMSRGYEGNVYTIYPSKSNRGVPLTEEHPVLIADNKGETKWVAAGLVEFGFRSSSLSLKNYKSYVCLPKLQNEFNSISLEKYNGDIYEYSSGHAKKKNPKLSAPFNDWENIKSSEILDEEFAYFLGLFAAEGHISKDHCGSGGLTFDKNETKLIDFCTEFLYKRFGINTQKYPREEKSSTGIDFCCSPFSYFLANACGMGAPNKKIPVEIMMGSNEVKRAFVEGVLDGDGKDPNQPKNKNKNRYISSVSHSLIWQLRTIFAHLGQWSSVSIKQEAGTSRFTNNQKSYGVHYSDNSKYMRSIDTKDYLIKPISRITKEHRKCTVYNFEVEEDNSYVSDFILHNCEVYLKPHDGYVIGPGYKKIFNYFHLTLWAQNQTGYKNLLALSNASWGPGRVVNIFGNLKPRITWEDLEDYNEGIICGSGCIEGPIVKPFLRGEKEMALYGLGRLMDIFASDNRLFMEVMPHNVDRNWETKGIIQVEGENGFTYTFKDTDMLETSMGVISAQEACERRVVEVFSSVNNRPQEFPLSNRVIDSPLGIADEDQEEMPQSTRIIDADES